MEKKTQGPVDLVVRPAPVALKLVVILVLVFSIAALTALGWVHQGIRAETQRLRGEAAAYEYANADLMDKTQRVGSVQGVKDIAQAELGMISPDAVIITPQP